MKKLHRSVNDKMIGGIVGGFAEYITADPTLVRLGYILLLLIFPIPCILFYIICWFVIPKNPTHIKKDHTKHTEDTVVEDKDTEKGETE